MLEPLLRDLKSFEEDGLFVPCLGKIIKGTVFSVIADNLGAHSVAGFVESFSGSYICRFCVGERSQFQELEVRTGSFPARTIQQHQLDIETALASNTHSHGVKRHCAITQRLNHFHVTTDYPPDVLHGLLEGIVPVEFTLCLLKNTFLLKCSMESSNISHINGKTGLIVPKAYHKTLPPIKT